MDTKTEGGTPPPAVVTPAAAPAVASSSTSPDDINSKVRTAPNTPAALAALTKQLRENPSLQLKKGEPKPAAQPTQEPAAVEETPAAEPEPEETPAPETEQSATEQPAEAAEPDETEDGGDGPVTAITGKRTHLRLAETDQVGRLAASYMKRNRDMPMEEALDKARNQLGVKPKGEDTPKTEPAVPGMPQTVEETQQAIAQSLADYKKAMTEVRFEDAADLQAKLLDLTQHRSSLERTAERAEAQAATKFDADFKSSETKAAELYAFAADPNSAGAKRMREIEAEMKSLDDPLYYSEHKPLKIAQMVAAELNIAPRKKGAPAPVATAAPAAQPKKGVVPSGASRTTPPPINQPSAIDTKVKAVNSKLGLRNLYKELGLPVPG